MRPVQPAPDEKMGPVLPIFGSIRSDLLLHEGGICPPFDRANEEDERDNTAEKNTRRKKEEGEEEEEETEHGVGMTMGSFPRILSPGRYQLPYTCPMTVST